MVRRMNKVAKVAAIITLIIIIGVSLNYFTSLILERKTTITLRTSSPSSTTSAMSKTTTSTSTLPVAATRTGVPEGFVKVWVNGSIVSWSYCGRIVASIGFKPNVTLITSSSGLDLDLMVLGLNVFKVDEPILIERIRYVNSTGEVLEIPVGLLINTTRLKNLVFTTPCKQLKRIDLTLIPLIEDLEVKPYTLTIPVETVEEYELVEYREEKDTRNLKYTKVHTSIHIPRKPNNKHRIRGNKAHRK